MTSLIATVTRPATIRARRPSGAVSTFNAEHAELRGPFVVATGNYADSPQRGAAAEHVWPARRVLEVRFEAVEA